MISTLTPQQLAAHWGINTQTLAKWRQLGTGPAYIKLGRGRTARIRYKEKDIERYEMIQKGMRQARAIAREALNGKDTSNEK